MSIDYSMLIDFLIEYHWTLIFTQTKREVKL